MKNMKTSKFSYCILFIIPIIFFVMYNFIIDNDFWFTIAEGKYVLQNGFPHTVPFTIYNNLDFIYQSWGTGVIFYLIHKYFGLYGMLFFVVIILVIITYLYYKLCMLVSNYNCMLSKIITIITMCFLSTTFITTRPQIFTYLNLILVLYIMELYAKTNNKKYLLILPIMSLIQINLHGMFFLMLFIFMLPYVVNAFGFNFKNNNQKKYDLKPIILIMIVMLLTGLINPYGIKNIIYVFTSYGQKILNETIIELRPLLFEQLFDKMVIILIFIIYFLYFKCKNIPMRYYLLLFGTTYLAFDCVRSIALFMIASLFPLSYLYKDKIPNIDIDKFIPVSLKCFITIALLVVIIIFLDFMPKNFFPSSKEPIDYLEKNFDTGKMRLYINFDDGSYAVYKEIKVNIDPRAEVYLKKNNHKSDIYNEYNSLSSNKMSYKKYLDKYKFTHLLVKKNDPLYKKLRKDSYNYTLIKKFKNYDVYINLNNI